MELPEVLERCDIDAEHRDMTLDSLKAMGSGMSAKFQLPGAAPSKEELVDDFAHTIEDWSAHRWFDFGYGLGQEMRKSAIAGFPMKYNVGADGLLRKQLSAIERAGLSHT